MPLFESLQRTIATRARVSNQPFIPTNRVIEDRETVDPITLPEPEAEFQNDYLVVARAQVDTATRRGVSGTFVPSGTFPDATGVTHNGKPLATYAGRQFCPSIIGWIKAIVEQFGVTVSSGYRTPEQNAAAGGVVNSDHLSGLAVDLSGPESILASAKVWIDSQIGSDIWSDIHDPGPHLHISFRGSRWNASV